MVIVAPQALANFPEIISVVNIEDVPNRQPEDWGNLGLTEIWEKSRDWFNGLHTDSLIKKYLIRKVGELHKTYSNRVKAAKIRNFYREAINTHVALTNKFVILEGSPTVFNDDKTIVNIYNSTLKLWDERITQIYFRDGTVLCGVGFNGIRPYFFHTSVNSVTAVNYIAEGFNKKLSRLAFKQTTTKRDGKDIESFVDYQLVPGNNQLAVVFLEWEKVDNEFTITNAEFLEGANGSELNEIPICLLSVTDNLNFSQDNFPLPPLEDTRRENEVAFNKESELDTVETTLNLPTLLRLWLNRIPNPAPRLFLGTSRVIEHQAGGDIKYLEPSGSGIEITSKRQEQRRRDLKNDQEKLFSVNQSDGERTATESLLDAAQAKQILESVITKKEQLYINLFRFWALFGDPEFSAVDNQGLPNRAGGLNFIADLTEGIPEPKDVQQTLDSVDRTVITTLESRKRLHRIGFLVDEDLESTSINVLPEELETQLPDDDVIEDTENNPTDTLEGA